MAYTTIASEAIGLADGDTSPEPLYGTVRITPRFPASATGTGLTVSGPVVVSVDAGVMPETEVPSMTDATALVEFHLYGHESGPAAMPNTEIPIEPNATVRLSEFLPLGVDPATGKGLVKGEPGPGITSVTGSGGNIFITWEGGGSATIPMPDAIEGPKGDKGEKGDRGSAGPKGPIGPAGSVELTGVVPTIRVDGTGAAIGGREIVTQDDPKMPLTHYGDYRFAWADDVGHVAMGIREDATVEINRRLSAPAASIDLSALGPEGIQPSMLSDDWRYAFTDEEGHISAGVSRDGSFQIFRGTGAPSSIRSTVVCMGDSLTKGSSVGETWTTAESYPSLLEAQNPHVTVINQGYSGRTIDEIRFHTGSLRIAVTPSGGIIPASGTVALTTKQAIGWSSNITQQSCILAGVPGTFTRTSTEMTFSRSAPGSAVEVDGTALVVPTVPDYSASTVVIWAGRNDVTNATTGAEETVADHVVAGALEFVDWLSPRVKSVLVLGTTNRTPEREGTAGYETVIEINDRLSSLLPHRYLNIRRYLVHQLIYDAGITPTSDDLAQMDADAPPGSVWDGGSHYRKQFAPFVAQFIGNKLSQKGFI